MPLDEGEKVEDRRKYNNEWSDTAEDRGILFQTPFVNELFVIQPCFYDLCRQATPRPIDPAQLPPGNHTRNNMLLGLAKSLNIDCFGIDLPGAYKGHLVPGKIDKPSERQRFCVWNMLRDSWMSSLISRSRKDNPEALICIFVGSDHNEGLQSGSRVTKFSFPAEGGGYEDRVVSPRNSVNLNLLNETENVVYLKSRSDQEEGSNFNLKESDQQDGTWNY